MHRRRLIRLSALLAALLVCALVGTRVAEGYFTGLPGFGSGALPVAEAEPLAIEPAQIGVGLYPGSTVGLAVGVSNPSDQPARIESLLLDPSQGTGGVSSAKLACTEPALLFAPQSNDGAGWTIPPRADGVDGFLRIQLPAAIAMGPTAANACQGAVFTIHLKAGP